MRPLVALVLSICLPYAVVGESSSGGQSEESASISMWEDLLSAIKNDPDQEAAEILSDLLGDLSNEQIRQMMDQIKEQPAENGPAQPAAAVPDVQPFLPGTQISNPENTEV